MPIYEYACPKCGHHAEIWQKISDSPRSKCELCNGKMKKLISQSTFHLKGTGWYVTDYASKKDVNEGKKETPSKEKDAAPSKEKDATPVKAKDSSEKPKKEASSPKAKTD